MRKEGNRQAFGIVVEWPLGLPASHGEVPGSSPGLCF